MTLADEINRMIIKIVESLEITSANPTHTNTVIQANEMEKPDLEAMINKGSDTDVKEKKSIDGVIKKVDKWENGAIGDINRFTSQQLGNLKDFVSNPAQFMIQSVFRKFAKGLGVVAFALIIFEAVKWIISELLKPGRLLDIRFKRDIRDEIIQFRRREEQQKIKQGFSNIIITTAPRLRGGYSQATNTLDIVRTGGQFPTGFGQSNILLEASGMPLSKAKGRRSFGGAGT